MSIWATRFHLDLPGRDEWGEPDDHEPDLTLDVAGSWSSMVRISTYNATYGPGHMMRFLTADEARNLAAALISAADYAERDQ